jgi:hypothetical protein
MIQSSSTGSIGRGTCYALFAYDVGIAIRLEEAGRRITAAKERSGIQPKRRAPEYFEFRPQPLRVILDAPELTLGRFRTTGGVEVLLYDFGAVSVTYRVPVEGTFADLLALSEELYGNAQLLADSRHHVERLMAAIGAAVDRPNILPHVEDYLVFHVAEPAGSVSAPVWAGQEHAMARVLRSERMALAADEVRDATSCAIAFAPEDYALIDWNAALLFGPGLDDTRAVLEYANAELLEMRVLDQQLDAALDQAYEVLTRAHPPRFRLPGAWRTGSERIAQLQVDSALLFERVTNSVKLLGDQYLARVYRLASQRFHLAAWDSGILRKLETLDNIYEKLTDRAATRRMEVLEWVIILLIALEIVINL